MREFNTDLQVWQSHPDVVVVEMDFLDKYYNSSLAEFCRRLVKDGFKGRRVEVYREGTLALFTNNIGEAAKLTIFENNKVGPKFGKYRPFPADKVRPQQVR